MGRVPIFITQHMPATFTAVLAEHIEQACGAYASEGRDGEVVEAGHIYVAPGGYHMEIKTENAKKVIRLNQGPMVNSCRPSADPMFESISHAYGANVLAMVLTGIGSDGTEGAKKIAKNGGRIIAQDAASSVVYGMPRYVAEAGICEAILPLSEIANYITKNS
ncbi:MAG: chemotaxis protein CheB [Alphaproteobacteria bacterium]|nr:chemotaxis protein CheB [Alphaproteobacteria bacterium]